MIAGVCSGLAEYLGWDPTIVRILFVILSFASYGAAIFGYFILAVVMPD